MQVCAMPCKSVQISFFTDNYLRFDFLSLISSEKHRASLFNFHMILSKFVQVFAKLLSWEFCSLLRLKVFTVLLLYFQTIRTKLRPLRKGMRSNIFDNMLAMMEKYANNLETLVDERTHLLIEEKQKTEDLLHLMLPKPVAEQLKQVCSLFV